MRRAVTSVLVLVAALLVGCTTDAGAEAEGETSPGDVFADRCEVVRELVRASVRPGEIRWVQFLPPGSTGGLNFYAPMRAEPLDDVAHIFYGRGVKPGVAQITHYRWPHEVADFLGKCLLRGYGFIRRSYVYEDRRYTAVFFDERMKRKIAIQGDMDSVGMLVSDPSWRDDPQIELARLIRSELE